MIEESEGVVQTPLDEDKVPILSKKCSQYKLTGGLTLSGFKSDSLDAGILLKDPLLTTN